MKLAHLGAIATTIAVVIGLVMVIVPAYTHTLERNEVPPVMLSFSIRETRDISIWCTDLSLVLEKHDVPAAVFVTGSVADKHPECVTSFNSGKLDIGSQTYSYAKLTDLEYTNALEEVKKGKSSIDTAGKLNSRLFKAPYESTDENIYSLLSSSGIIADFSYDSQYNKYEGDQFVKYDVSTYKAPGYSSESIRSLLADKKPLIIKFENSDTIPQIDNFISALTSDSSIRLVNASELAGLELTLTGEQI